MTRRRGSVVYGDAYMCEGTTAITWLATPEGRACLKGSSDDWCEASIASGTDASAARAAADRTYAAYTGT